EDGQHGGDLHRQGRSGRMPRMYLFPGPDASACCENRPTRLYNRLPQFAKRPKSQAGFQEGLKKFRGSEVMHRQGDSPVTSACRPEGSRNWYPRCIARKHHTSRYVAGGPIMQVEPYCRRCSSAFTAHPETPAAEVIDRMADAGPWYALGDGQTFEDMIFSTLF